MRAKRALGVASASAVVGVAMVIPASIADAGTTYNSTATATPGSMSIQGNNVPVTTGPVTATDANRSASRSQSLKTVGSTLSSINSQAGSAAQKDIPPGADLIAEVATASPDGTSSACSAVVTQGCVGGRPQPVTINTSGASASEMSAGPAASGDSGAVLLWGIVPVKRSALLPLPRVGSGGPQLPRISGLSGGAAQPNQAAPASSSSAASGLSGYSAVVTGYGPTAVCTAGPAGTSGPSFGARSIPGTMTVNIYNNGKSIFPNGQPVTLKPGNILAQLPLDATLNSLVAGSGIKSVDFSSTQGTENPNGPETSATGGEESLSAQSQPVMDIKGGKVTCGPNKAAAVTSPSPASGSGSSGTGSSSGASSSGTGGSGTSSSTEKPLGGGIQTDEGRSGSAVGFWPAPGFQDAQPGA